MSPNENHSNFTNTTGQHTVKLYHEILQEPYRHICWNCLYT